MSAHGLRVSFRAYGLFLHRPSVRTGNKECPALVPPLSDNVTQSLLPILHQQIPLTGRGCTTRSPGDSPGPVPAVAPGQLSCLAPIVEIRAWLRLVSNNQIMLKKRRVIREKSFSPLARTCPSAREPFKLSQVGNYVRVPQRLPAVSATLLSGASGLIIHSKDFLT
jgi:hypothetical protein